MSFDLHQYLLLWRKKFPEVDQSRPTLPLSKSLSGCLENIILNLAADACKCRLSSTTSFLTLFHSITDFHSSFIALIRCFAVWRTLGHNHDFLGFFPLYTWLFKKQLKYSRFTVYVSFRRSSHWFSFVCVCVCVCVVCTYICILFRFFALVPCVLSRSLLVICLIYSSVTMSVHPSNLSLPSPSPW